MTPAGQSLLGEDRLAVIVDAVKRCVKFNGEVWECGVYAGGSALFIARALADMTEPPPFRLFDTFTGIALAQEGIDFHKDGDFGDVELNDVCRMMNIYPFVSIHQGVFPATFNPFVNSKICFAHVDCDVYASVDACMKFIWPRLQPGGIIIADDYFHPNCLGANKAINEFMAREKGWWIQSGEYPQLIINKNE